MVKPIILLAQSPKDVVRPFIWLRELKSMEFMLIMAMETMDAADIMKNPVPVSSKI
jgi:hypothetical protein